MARNIEQIKDLARHSVNGTAPADFSASAEEIDEVLAEELNNLAKDYNTYRRNKFDIFEIIQEVADVAVPKNVMATMGRFAEIRQFKDNVRPQFKVKKGRARAKRFVTRAAQAGVYRAFRLDTDTIDVNTYAMGTAAYIDFERVRSGDENMAEMAQIITESIQDAIYEDVQKALRATINEVSRPAANKAVMTNFDKDEFARVIATVKKYGDGAVIFAPPEFVATIPAEEISGTVSSADLEDIRTKGYVGIFRGTPIVQLPQSFVDETNTATLIDPQIAYIFPTGGEKIVKVAFEGNTIVKDWENRDLSMEIQAYKKLGIAIMSYHNWGIVRNTSIAQTYTGPVLD